jgi:ribosomal protein S26
MVGRPSRKVFGRFKPRAGGETAMQCDICGAEIANSEAMKDHKEREHPMGDQGDEELEAPDMLSGQEQGAPIVPGKN